MRSHQPPRDAVPQPNVFAYIDFRTFLRDWFEARKTDDSAYSYAAFAQAGGCSKAALANVLSGARNPRTETLDAFARAMDLDPPARNYLGLLVDLATAPDTSARREVMDKILSAERYGQLRWAEDERETDVFRYLEHWYLPAIRELAGHPSFQAEPEWVAQTLSPPIAVDAARAALDTLFDLGLIYRGESGRIERREVRFRTRTETQQHAAADYHRRVIPDLLRDIDTKDGKTQHLLAATLSLPTSMLPEAKARLNGVFEYLATAADDAADDDRRRVYQLAIQLFPVSEELS